MRTALLIAAVSLLAGCPPATTATPFASGDFSFQTTGVVDGCFDGGFDLLFMPEGPTVPNDFGSTIYVPAVDELPSTYNISLSDPFKSTDVTVTGADDTRTIAGALNIDVELDPTAYPGCLVDMSIDVDLTIVDADNVQGTAVLNTSSFDEGSCPVVTADPCNITLDIVGVRAN